MCALGVLVLAAISVTYTAPRSHLDASQCRQVYMRPSYVHMLLFDASHTRFASKYALHLYREQDTDEPVDGHRQGRPLSGVPVLFLPGNAGSYKQVRLLALEAAAVFYNQRPAVLAANPRAANLDFFSADFNEDFTAFHGRTMLDQAEYANDAIAFILLLYARDNQPLLVLVVGHSMGGMVARVMLTMDNYVDGLINTIVTFATPHAAAPLTFDRDILQVYDTADGFWRMGYADTRARLQVAAVARERLANVLLVSITGGISDLTLPADYTTLTGLVPPSNGFSVFSTGIPGVWTPIDHLAIVWCHQLRHVVVKALLELVDVRLPTRTLPLADRMRVLRRHFLSGFESYATEDSVAVPSPAMSIQLKLDNSHVNSGQPGERVLRLDGSERAGGSNMHLFYLPKDEMHYQFLLIALRPLVAATAGVSEAAALVMLCRNRDGSALPASLNMHVLDLTKPTTQKYIELECVDAVGDARRVPRSSRSTQLLADLLVDGPQQPFQALQFRPDQLAHFDMVVVDDRWPTRQTEELLQDGSPFLVAELSRALAAVSDTGRRGLLALMVSGALALLPASHPIVVDIHVPGAWSSLLAYKAEFRSLKLTHDEAARLLVPLFEPMVRQWTDHTLESKWQICLKDHQTRTVTTHGTLPYVVYAQPALQHSLHLQLWSDSLLDELPIDVYVLVDWWRSFAQLAMRFRLAIAAFPPAVAAIVVLLQFRHFNRHGVYPTFGEGLVRLMEARILLPILAACLVLLAVAAHPVGQWVLHLLDVGGGSSATAPPPLHRNNYFLGLLELALFYLGPVLFVCAVAIVAVVYVVVCAVGRVFAAACVFAVGLMVLSPPTPIQRHVLAALGNRDPLLRLRRRLLGTILLLGAVPFYLPFQFAYVVCCVLQAVITLRLAYRDHYARCHPAAQPGKETGLKEELGPKKTATISSEELRAELPTELLRQPSLVGFHNMFHYNMSFFVLMLLVLPVNIPVLVVWVHNFLLRWQTPFLSHHNFLAVMPIVVLAEKHLTQTFFNKAPTRLPDTITQLLLGYFAVYGFVYGVRHTFWLHYMFNFWCGWMLVVFYTDNFNFSASRVPVPRQPAVKVH